MITAEMTIEDVLLRYPGSAEIFARFGLGCGGCQIATVEQIAHGADVHRVDLDKLLAELNNLAASGPQS